MIGRHWIAVMLIASCCVGVPAQEEATREKASVPKAKNLYPLEVGLRWVYRNPDGRERVVVVGERGEGPERRLRYRMFVRVGDYWEPGVWMELREDGVWSRSLDPGASWEPLLRDPLSAGATWNWSRPEENFEGDWEVQCEVLEPDKIKVPAGEFSCVRIKRTRHHARMPYMDDTKWYAEGVGLVREEWGWGRGVPVPSLGKMVLVSHDRMSHDALREIRDPRNDVAICLRRLRSIYGGVLLGQTRNRTLPRTSGSDFVLEAWKAGLVNHTVKAAEWFFCASTGNRPLPDLSNVTAAGIDWTGPDQGVTARGLKTQQRTANAVVIVCSKVPTNNGTEVHGGKGVCVLYLGGAVDFIPAERFGGKIVIGPESPLPELRNMVPGP